MRIRHTKFDFCRIIVSVLVCVVVSVCFLADPKKPKPNYGETDDTALSEAQLLLKGRLPQYFGLDASEGLDVYVWQMAKGSYSFGLLPHNEQGRDWLSEELLNLRGTRAEEMRLILSTYNVNEDKIYVIPWQNPISSYIGEYWIVKEGEDINAGRAKYIEKLRKILFDVDCDEAESKVIAALNDVSLIYDALPFSYVMDKTLVPKVQVCGNVLHNITDGQELGTVLQIELADTDFVNLMGKYGESDKQKAVQIQQDNDITYEVTPIDSNGIGLYYVLLQKDGSTLLVYGHYENGKKKNDCIRWIYQFDNLQVFYAEIE